MLVSFKPHFRLLFQRFPLQTSSASSSPSSSPSLNKSSPLAYRRPAISDPLSTRELTGSRLEFHSTPLYRIVVATVLLVQAKALSSCQSTLAARRKLSSFLANANCPWRFDELVPSPTKTERSSSSDCHRPETDRSVSEANQLICIYLAESKCFLPSRLL